MPRGDPVDGKDRESVTSDNDGLFPHLEFGYSVLRIMAQLMRATRTRQGWGRPQLADRMGVNRHRLTHMEDPMTPSQDVVDLVGYCIWMAIDPCALIDDACEQYRENGSRPRPRFTVTETILPAPPAQFGLDPLRANVVASQTRTLMVQARIHANVTSQTMGERLGCSERVILRMEYEGPCTPDPLRARNFLSYCDALARSPAALLREAILAARVVTP
jgi:DNA-binding XRE family transcriptional regulator